MIRYYIANPISIPKLLNAFIKKIEAFESQFWVNIKSWLSRLTDYGIIGITALVIIVIGVIIGAYHLIMVIAGLVLIGHGFIWTYNTLVYGFLHMIGFISDNLITILAIAILVLLFYLFYQIRQIYIGLRFSLHNVKADINSISTQLDKLEDRVDKINRMNHI